MENLTLFLNILNFVWAKKTQSNKFQAPKKFDDFEFSEEMNPRKRNFSKDSIEKNIKSSDSKKESSSLGSKSDKNEKISFSAGQKISVPGNVIKGGESSNDKGLFFWIFLIGTLVVAVIVIGLIIYAVWLYFSPQTSSKVEIIDDLKSDGMTEEERERFEIRFGHNEDKTP